MTRVFDLRHSINCCVGRFKKDFVHPPTFEGFTDFSKLLSFQADSEIKLHGFVCVRSIQYSIRLVQYIILHIYLHVQTANTESRTGACWLRVFSLLYCRCTARATRRGCLEWPPRERKRPTDLTSSQASVMYARIF